MAGAGYKTFAAADVLTAAQVNTYLMQQSVPRFATTAARDAAITAPSSGQLAYVDSSDRYEGVYGYNGVEWNPPWNLPWGWLNVYTPAAFNFTSTIAYSATFSPQLVDNRIYKFTITGRFNNSSVVTGFNTASLYLDSSSVLVGEVMTANPASASGRQGASGVTYYTATSSGALAFKIGAVHSASATTQSFVTNSVIVEDMGPNGAPA
jgi:hypothetical protein